ncbi:hypothetical protein ACFW1A_39890, partial [Kitasatospora sp. NPDC058965]|uniref:hypothetical protein n=1 Tax=Kitasatospora sp. NPDC058965 TaxID=3346682 RepID=UPI0036A57BFE
MTGRKSLVTVSLVAALSMVAPMAHAETVVGGYHYKGKVWAADPLPKSPKVAGHNAGASAKPPVVAEPKGSRELKPHQVA